MERYFFIIGNRLNPVPAWLLAICMLAFIASFVLSANDAPEEASFLTALIMLWSMTLFGICYFYSGTKNASIAEKQGPMMRKYLSFMAATFFVFLVLLTARIFFALLR